MHNTPRPSLDATTVWRAQQVARREGRSLAAAIARLVDEAWQARHQAQVRSAERDRLVEMITRQAGEETAAN